MCECLWREPVSNKTHSLYLFPSLCFYPHFYFFAVFSPLYSLSLHWIGFFLSCTKTRKCSFYFLEFCALLFNFVVFFIEFFIFWLWLLHQNTHFLSVFDSILLLLSKVSFSKTCNAEESIAVLNGSSMVHCNFCTTIFFYRAQKRDWLLKNGQTLIKKFLILNGFGFSNIFG